MPADFAELIKARRSVRAFTDAPVPRAAVEAMCRAARRAPSGANLQPGRFHVLTGTALTALTKALQDAVDANQPHDREYSYFPEKMSSELKSRQRQAGYALYEALGVARRDIKGRKRQFDQNYRFFGAPVGVVVTIDRDMGKGCFMDLGMALMSFLLAAEDLGYGATGIGALANFGTVVHRHLNLPENELVVCGIAVGKTDMAAPVNQCRTERLALEEFTTFAGFDDSV